MRTYVMLTDRLLDAVVTAVARCCCEGGVFSCVVRIPLSSFKTRQPGGMYVLFLD